MRFQASALVALALPLASAFRVTFYISNSCRSQALETRSMSFEGLDCLTIPVNAVSATVTPEDGDLDHHHVSFFTADDCHLNDRVASRHQGCVNFHLGSANRWMVTNDMHLARAETSTNVRRQPKGINRKRSDEAVKPWQLAKQEAREKLGLADDEGTGSLAPNWEFNEDSSEYQHGQEVEVNGETLKLQQLAPGVFGGVRTEEWDNSLDVKGEEFLAFGSDAKGDYSDRLEALKKREACEAQGEAENETCENTSLVLMNPTWNHGLCRALLTCGARITGQVGAIADPAFEGLVRCAKAVVPIGRTLYDHIHWQTIFCTLGDWSGSALIGQVWGVITSAGGATAQDNDELKQCSTGNTQSDAILAGLRTQINSENDSAVTYSLTLPNGKILEVRALIYEEGKRPNNSLCGVHPHRRAIEA